MPRGERRWNSSANRSPSQKRSIGWDDVNGIGFDTRSILHFDRRHGGDPGEQDRKKTLMVGRQVLHDHECHAGRCGERFE